MAAVSTAIIEILMNHNVVVGDLRDDHAHTPLHYVVFHPPRDPAVLRMLIDVCGVDLEARNYQHETCTEIAVGYSGIDALRLVLWAGADVNSAKDAEPLLHRSVWSRTRGFTRTVLLLAAGADVTARDRRGRTACHVAATQSAQLMSLVHAMVAAGADIDAADYDNETPRRRLAASGLTVDPEQVETARREIAKARLDLVRQRALQVCIGLQSRGLDALQMCEILQFACGPSAQLVAFHQWWAIATTVKHFKRQDFDQGSNVV
jgi:hypothetical protein